MREAKTDIWTSDFPVIAVTTNGSITKHGYGVMGRGVALQAKQRYLALPIDLGWHLQTHGNHVGIIRGGNAADPLILVAFPVKYYWSDDANLDLIARSAQELVSLTNLHGWVSVGLPRPGCGNGRLAWDHVEPVIRPILDDRFTVVTR